MLRLEESYLNFQNMLTYCQQTISDCQEALTGYAESLVETTAGYSHAITGYAESATATLAAYKDPAKAICEKLAISLFWGAALVDMYSTLAPTMNGRTCESAEVGSNTFFDIVLATFVYDTGNFLYALGIFSRAGLLPLMGWATNKTSEAVLGRTLLTDYRLEQLNYAEYFAMDLIGNAIFTNRTIGRLSDLFKFPNELKRSLSYISLLPDFVQLIDLGMQRFYQDYPSKHPTWSRLREAFPGQLCVPLGFTLLQALKSGLMFASGGDALLWPIIDLFIDARSDNDFVYTNQVLVGSFGILMTVGAAFVLNDLAYQYGKEMAKITNMQFLSLMPPVSILACLLPKIFENVNTYSNYGIYPVLGIWLASLGLAGAHTYITHDHSHLAPTNNERQPLLNSDRSSIQDSSTMHVIIEDTQNSPLVSPNRSPAPQRVTKTRETLFAAPTPIPVITEIRRQMFNQNYQL